MTTTSRSLANGRFHGVAARFLIQVGFAVLASAAFVAPAWAQLNYGRIFGAVTDQSGGAILGATVTVIDVARGVSRPLMTDTAGEYSAPSLLPGTYTVHVEAKGFQSVDRTQLVVEVGEDLRVDVGLQPGEQNQTVTVTEALPMINTSNAQLSSSLEDQAINELPLQGRVYSRLLDFSPGMEAAPGDASPTYSVNGNRANAQVWMIDGVEDLDVFDAAGPIIGLTSLLNYLTILPLDSIQEVNIIANPKAEYGWKPGAQVNVGLKSGTNNLHGTVYGVVRNAAMDAKSPFLGPTLSRAEDDFEQFGASVGGPVKKDKIFYFGNYEGFRFKVGSPQIVQIPSSVSIGGTSGPSNSFPDAISATQTFITANPTAKNPATGAALALSPLSLNLAGCTAAGACNAANGIFNNGINSASVPIAINNVGSSDNGLWKMDYHLNDRNSVNGEYYFGESNDDAAQGIHSYWDQFNHDRAQLGRGVWVWTPNSSWVNEARFGYDRSGVSIHPAECTQNLGQPNYSAQFGFDSGAGLFPPYCGFPVTTISGFATLSGGVASAGIGMLYTTGTYSFIDSVSYTRGKHLFKFGGEYHLTRYTGSGQPVNSTGTLNFGTAGVSAFTGATALEDFLTGVPSTGAILVGNPVRNTDQSLFAGFFQDDWRLTSRITANLGLRYEYQTPLTERNNLMANFDPSAQTGLLQETSGDPVYHTSTDEFGPRVGLAWDVTGKGTTVVRAGASVVYNLVPYTVLLAIDGANLAVIPTAFTFYKANGSTIAGTGNIAAGTVSLSSNQLPWAVNTPVFGNSISAETCGNGLGQVNQNAAISGSNPANPPPCTLLSIDPNFKKTYVTEWNLAIQHAFTNNLTLNVAYVGDHGTHLGGVIDGNQPTPGSANTTSPPGSGNEIQRRPYYSQFPWFGQIRSYENELESNYNGLQMNLVQRVSHGLSFTGSYTFAHALDEFSAENNAFLMSNNPRLDYGNSSITAAQHGAVTLTYLIPGKKLPGQMLEGWQFNTTINLLGSVPFNAADTSSDISGTGELEDRWTLVGPAHDFTPGGPGPLPCFGIPAVTGSTVAQSSFSKASNCVTVGMGTSANPTEFMPPQCISAASGEPNGPGATTGLQSLAKFGCYLEGGAVIVPPAQGTFGTMGRDVLRDQPLRNWDISLLKNWHFRERFTGQFRAEFFNILNVVEYASPSSNPNVPTTFGESTSTPNLPRNPVFGNNGARQIQLGLKLIF